eukprot:TRINITY_DN804_c0_g1_i1.p1 TRINITY_DN804_c0_g1~~TRINITY_DN804_c0_g1_i1.p1  ORF type:complete len:680 (+),score=137.38 TRINITY_DN804_c0_g1_i1:1-2040(+)
MGHGCAALPRANMSLDQTCVNTIRCLAADVVQKAESGHPGAPMGCAPMAHVLWSRVMKYNPSDPKWFARDRFVLSNGHACALQYIMLHLTGYAVSMDELKRFRQLGSITPGHPENFLTPGVEVSTGPLGQGLSNAVGLALAEKHLAARFNKPGFPLIDNYTYVICGDGCLQEGVTSEASSLAGHLRLGKLIVLYDDNNITIDGETEISFTEDVIMRYQAYGWHTQVLTDGNSDVDSILRAIEAAKAVADKPSLIKVKTVIGFGSKKQGTEKTHGAPLGAEDVAHVKKSFGFNPAESFVVPEPVSQLYRSAVTRGQALEQEWQALFAKYTAAFPDDAKLLTRLMSNALPPNWEDVLPKYTAADPAKATRQLSEICLNKLAEVLPELMGGSADLTGSNLTYLKCSQDFQHATPLGRNVRFGVREHGMAAICNGMHAYGGVLPYCATFLNFVGYAAGAVRLSSLSHHQVIYVMTHDSIGLGEDGPTHQPIETIPYLRSMPNHLLIRPADGNETSGGYILAVRSRNRPSTLCFSRHAVPNLAGSSIEGTLKGAYVIHDVAVPAAVLISTGSEVSIAIEAAKLLGDVRVVSAPCLEIFDEQPLVYQRSLFPPGLPIISVEMASTFGWASRAHVSIGIDRFGASAPAKALFAKFGFTADQIAVKTKAVIAHYKGAAPDLYAKPAL